jgi:cytochrome P450
MYPDVQRKAQEQLDEVLRGSLPEFADIDKLPYIVAIVNEVMRWQPATPLGEL